MFGTGSAVFQAPFLTDNNPDDRRTVNMDFEPTYFSEEEMFQLQITHDAGDLTYSWSTGYTETAYSSTEDYEKGVTTGDWQPGLDALVDLGNAHGPESRAVRGVCKVSAAGSGWRFACYWRRQVCVAPFMVDYAGPGRLFGPATVPCWVAMAQGIPLSHA